MRKAVLVNSTHTCEFAYNWIYMLSVADPTIPSPGLSTRALPWTLSGPIFLSMIILCLDLNNFLAMPLF